MKCKEMYTVLHMKNPIVCNLTLYLGDRTTPGIPACISDSDRC